MRLIAAAIARHLIDAEIRSARFPGHDPARWALPLIDAVQAQTSSWNLVELDEEEFGDLWLPAHQGESCHGDTGWLGEGDSGGTVRTLAAWLDRSAAEYAASNPSCWSRLTHAAAAPASTIVVSRFEVGDRIKPASSTLVTVDGLHRALAWWRRGDRACRAYLAER